MNNSNESDKLWNILLTNSTLEHNNKNNKQKDKIISAKYYWDAYSILDVFEISKPRGKKERKVNYLE